MTITKAAMVSISINFCMQIADWSSTKVYDSIIAISTLSPSNDQNRLLILFDDEFELESQTIEPRTEQSHWNVSGMRLQLETLL